MVGGPRLRQECEAALRIETARSEVTEAQLTCVGAGIAMREAAIKWPDSASAWHIGQFAGSSFAGYFSCLPDVVAAKLTLPAIALDPVSTIAPDPERL